MKITWQNCFRVGVTILLVYLCIFYWENVAGLFGVLVNASKPILIGLMMAYILNILMSFYEKHYFKKTKNPWITKSKRMVCMLCAMITLIGIITLVVSIVIPELIMCIKFLIAEIPPAIEKILQSDFVEFALPEEMIQMVSDIDWNELFTKATQILTSGLGSALNTVVSTVSVVSSFMITCFISVIFSIYFLLSKETLQQQVLTLCHLYLPEKINERFLHVLDVLNTSFHRYIVGQCMEAVILGVLCGIGMMICQFPYAMMIGTLVGFTALIPVAGAYIGACVGFVMILTVSPLKAILFLVFITILQQLEGNLIYPKVVGKSLGLPAVWVLAAVTIGGGLWGIIGMLMGVPVTSAIYRLIKEDVKNKQRALIE